MYRELGYFSKERPKLEHMLKRILLECKYAKKSNQMLLEMLGQTSLINQAKEQIESLNIQKELALMAELGMEFGLQFFLSFFV